MIESLAKLSKILVIKNWVVERRSSKKLDILERQKTGLYWIVSDIWQKNFWIRSPSPLFPPTRITKAGTATGGNH